MDATADVPLDTSPSSGASLERPPRPPLSTLATQRPTAGPAHHAPEAGAGAAAPQGRVLAWSLLFGALAAAGGHGVLLFRALRLSAETVAAQAGEAGLESLEQASEAPRTLVTQLVEVGLGRMGAVLLAWLLVSPFLALAVLALRRALLRSRLLVPLALVGGLATAGAFAFYLAVVVRPG